MQNESNTSMVPNVCREACLMLFAVLFGSLPFVAAAQAQENPAHQAGQTETAQAAESQACFVARA